MTPTFAGLAVQAPLIMGIVNVTPDSFSDGGDTTDRVGAIAHGRLLAGQGADIIDIGGESSRPGAASVSIDEELSRVIPVIEALAGDGVIVSIDSRNSTVMDQAVRAGAQIINDVTALQGEGSLDIATASGASVILMHMQGTPGTMQDNPHYEDAPSDVRNYLAGRIKACERAGMERHRIAVDPGIGFGKNLDHNLQILNRLADFAALDCPLVLGVSRKSFIARLSAADDPKQRLGGSLAAALAGISRRAAILRVHDVYETRQALDVWRAIEIGSKGY